MSALVLLLMFFAHIVDDFYLQGILAQLKQKKFWEEKAPDKKYRHDYVVALIVHAFSWAFMITLPYLWFVNFAPTIAYYIVMPINLIIHAVVDDLKANKLKINLWQDQSIHVLQIVATWVILCFVF